jgi:hypothetical protein
MTQVFPPQRVTDVDDNPEQRRTGPCLRCCKVELLQAGRKRGAAVYCASCAGIPRERHTVRSLNV